MLPQVSKQILEKDCFSEKFDQMLALELQLTKFCFPAYFNRKQKKNGTN